MDKRRDILSINIPASSDETILTTYLRKHGVSSQSLIAVKAYYTSMAICESTDSTIEQQIEAMDFCLSELYLQINKIISYHRRKSGIACDPAVFSPIALSVKNHGS